MKGSRSSCGEVGEIKLNRCNSSIIENLELSDMTFILKSIVKHRTGTQYYHCILPVFLIKGNIKYPLKVIENENLIFSHPNISP